MTKIKKLHHKRLNFPPQDVQSLRERIEAAPTNGIHEVLEPYTEWPFVRGDMYHWIPILNRFDEIMADANEKYKLAELQEVDFDSDTQKTLVSILRFSRLLLENCINRNLYSSVDRLDSLLNTSDPEVLENTLRLLLRASQRWSYQRDLRANQAVMSSRLLTLADPWHTKKDIAPPASSDAGGNIATHTNEFRLLARNENTELLKAHGGVIRYQFFRTAEDVEQLGEEAGASGPESAEPVAKETALPDARKKAGDSSSSSHRRTPSKKSHQPDSGRSLGAASEGLVSIHTPVSELGLDRSAGLHVQMRQAFAKLVAKYKVPRAHRYELRQRIYVALALFTGDSELRYTLLRSRIFSAAILSQLMNEREFKNAFLSREPNFTADIIGVLQPEVHAPLSVQTAVFLALDSLLKQRSEVSGAYVALNASANHGVLMFILRKAFTNVDGPPVFPYEFMSTLYFFLTGMANNMNGGQLLVSAGVVPVFVAALKHTHPQQLRSTGRVAKLLDYLISSTNSTFPAFCSANGIATLVERIHSEVQLAVAVSDANPEAAADLASPVALPPFSEYPVQLFRRREILPAEQIYLLKELFKLLTHLVQQPSYHDRLRNLVETTLPQTLCTVLNHPAAFGSNIYGMAISVSSMLVHNEPTSLPIIQEARLPETMLENLEKHIPYNSDVIMNIPGALGAFCLNDAGMEQVRSSSVISSTLRVFSDPDFIRILQEGDVTGSFGASLDEFMRHFPAVKEPVMDQVIEMLKSVLEMGQADSPLRQLNPGNTFLLRSAEGEELKPYYDDFYGMMLESVTTFLEGLLEQRAHSEMFMERGGWDLITQTIKSPMLPFSFVKSRTFDSLHGLASTLLDTSPERVFRSLFKVISELLIDESTSPTMMRTWPVANYLELANAAALSEPEYARAQLELHRCISCAGAIALVTYLSNGSGGGSLARCIKVIDDVIPRQEFMQLVGVVCDAFCSGVKTAVGIEHAIATISEAGESKKPGAKGKEAEDQSMDVDDATAVEPYVRTNYLNLGEVAIAFALETGDFIECISNSLRLGSSDDEGVPRLLPEELSATIVRFVLNMFEVCRGAEPTIAGAQLVDQAIIAIMKAMVFVRHRVYIKLRIFMRFIEENGMPQFCDLLGSMWDWAATLPPPPPPSSLSSQTAGAESTAPAADPDAKLRKALNNTLENMLSIMSFFVDGEPIMECPEYAMLAVEHDERRGWFRPGDMVVGLRLAALPTLQKIWESPLLVYGSSSSLMQAFIACLGPVVCAQHEARTNGSLPGIRRHLPGLMERHGLQSTRRGSGTQTPVPLLARTIGSFGRSSPLARTPVHASATAGPNPMYVSELEAMGFTTEQAEAALTRHSNNLARAANDLLSSAMTGGDRLAESSASAASGQAQGDQPVVSSEAAPEPAEPATASEGGTDSQAPEDSPTAGGAQPTQDSQPMSVDGSRQDPAGSNDDDGAGSANDSGSDGSGSRSNHGRRSPAQKGIEPYSLAEWRAAREAAEDENRLQLQKLRETLRESIAPRVIALVDAFKDQAVPQVCGVLELILRKNESGPATHVLLNAFTPLLDSVSVSGSGDTDERLAAHAYLWAVLLSSSPLMDEMYQHIGGLGQHLIRALGVAIQRQDKTPAWLTTLLLVVELLLVRDSEPPKCALEERATLTQIAKRRLTKLPPSSASINEAAEAAAAAGTSTAESSLLDQVFEPLSSSRPAAGSAFEPLLSTDEDGAPAEAAAEDNRSTKSPDAEPMFDLAQKVELQVLAMQFFADPVPEYTSPVLNALLRLVVVLTRSPEFAAEFMDSGSLANAVRALRTLKPVVLPCITEATAKEKTPLGFVNAIMSVSKDQQKELRQERTLVVHVLRHVIESQPVLRLIMENLIQGWFESPQFSSADVNTYVRGTLAYALRDPAAYTQVTTERCYLPSYNDEMRVSWMTLAWRSTKLLDEEEVDRFEALPEDTLDVPQSTSTDEAEDAKDRKSATDAKAPAEADADAEASKRAEPEQATPGSGFLEYLTQRKQEAPFKPYELDTKSEELACRIVEFVAEEILSLRPPGTIPPISRPATTTDMQAPATPSKQRSSSYAMLSAASAAPSVQAAAAPSDENPETIAYRCFLMQCMAELVASFPFALQAIFVARSTAPGLFSPRKDKGKGKAPAAPDERSASTAQPQSLLRVRSPLISHLVHVLIVREAMTSAKAPKKSKADEPAEGSELDQVVAVAQHQIAMKRGHLSRCVTFWATALLASMCVRHQEGWSTTASRDSPDGAPGSSEITQASLAGSYDKALSAARQLTLDHIVRAFRECLSASASGPGGADVIYARLTSLAQLTYKLVIARAINHGRASEPRGSLAEKPGEREGANALKKMILERGVLDLLTAACSRLNLNHPQSREMLNAFLRPMEHLSKAAVKISREAVLAAWEESGQEKMPLATGPRGFNMDLLEDENAQLDEDEDIPPDLYENSALGLHQNQGAAGDQYDDDDLMEEDYDEELYDDDNSSVSDIDTEDEAMDEDIMLNEGVGDDDDAMEMDTVMHEGGDDDDDDDVSDESDEEGMSGSDDDDDDDIDDESDDGSDDHDHGSFDADDIDHFRFALDNAINILQDDDDQVLQDAEERMMRAGEDDADFYSSGLGSADESEHGSDHDHDDGWNTELSDAEPSHLRRRPTHTRIAGRSRPASVGGSRDPLVAAGADRVSRSSSRAAGAVGAAATPGAELTPGTEAEMTTGDHLASSEAESDESGEEIDSFADDFPDTLEITMEAIDDHGNHDAMNSDLSNFILDTLAATMSDGHGPGARGSLRVNGLPGLSHGRPLGGINGVSVSGIDGASGDPSGRIDLLRDRDRDTLDFSLPRLPGLGRPGLAVGGISAAGQNMVHPLLDRGERADRGGMQARAERMALSTLNGPLRATPDDVYELGQSLATRLSTALSSGRRPAYTHRLVPGPSNRLGSTPWTQDSASERTTGMDSSVEGALNDSGSQALAVFEQLIRMCWAAAAIDGYTPLSTIERWQEEARMQFGGGATEFVSRIAHPVLNVLIPEAVCQNLLRSRYQVEVMRRTAVADRKRMEREDEARRQREEEARLAEEARLRAEDAKKDDEAAEGAEMAVDQDEDNGDGSSHQDSGAAPETADEPAEPVFVTVHGERVDITDTGIDLEFLLALPDDLRMEVIESRREELRLEQRTADPPPAAGASTGSEDQEGFIQEFLNALPVEIREEVMESGPLQRQLLEHEGMLQPRHAFVTTGAQSHLQPQQPSTARASASRVSAVEAAVRERVRVGASRGASRLLVGNAASTDGQGEEGRLRERRRKKIASRDIAVQLLSNAELVALARFVFLPNHALSSTLMTRIMQCVCENGRTRSHFIHLMLSILDSNATSLDEVDAVIRAALALDTAVAPAEPAAAGAESGTKTPQRGTGRVGAEGHPSSAALGTPVVSQFTAALVQQPSAEFSFPLSELHTEVPAYVSAQRCLETLHSLASHNARAAMHFLVEHHTLKARSSGSDDDSRFPVVHLLRLLAKPLYYSHGSAITELLMQLLSVVTKPLGSMVRRNQELQREPEPEPEADTTDKLRGMVQLPGIPDSALRAIVNVVAAGECTSRTFQHTLSLIQNLSHMPGVLPVITDELIKRASELSENVCADIGQLQHVLQALPPPEAAGDESGDGGAAVPAADAVSTELLDRVRDITLAKFSPASSHQSRLLRLLMAIDYISTTVAKRLEEKQRTQSSRMDVDAAADTAESAPSELLHLRSLALGHDSQFQPLWAATGRCLQYTSAHSELAHVATVLLPLIESFMVVFKPVVGERGRTAAGAAGTAAESSVSEADGGALVSPTSTQAVPTVGEAYFQSFTEKHKKVLNTLVRNNPGLLSGSFSLLVFNPHVLDFDNKRSYFYQRLHDDSSTRRGSTRPLGHMMQVNVRRRTVFEDSYHQFAGKSGDEIKRARINVKFHDEEGVDAGGVSREWFQALARQMFNPDYALFKPSASGRVTYQPNPQSWANPEHLLYFKFVGRIIGKAIVDQRVLDAYFTRSFYKHILGRKVDYRDMEAIDPSYYKSLEWILDNDITDVFEETFSIEVDDFGQHRVIDLIPNGHDVMVTEENKAEYVRLVTEQRLYRAIKDQINGFLTGFHDVIPKDLIQIFNEQELELLISGMPDVDVDDWRNNTEYHGGYNSSSAQIQWFWRAVRSFDQEERAKLLQFVTGTSKVPLEGFAHLQGNQGVQKFQIHKDFASPTRLPTAHTCFNQLDLPLYDSFDSLKSNLLLAVSECSTGFGFV